MLDTSQHNGDQRLIYGQYIHTIYIHIYIYIYIHPSLQVCFNINVLTFKTKAFIHVYILSLCLALRLFCFLLHCFLITCTSISKYYQLTHIVFKILNIMENNDYLMLRICYCVFVGILFLCCHKTVFSYSLRRRPVKCGV